MSPESNQPSRVPAPEAPSQGATGAEGGAVRPEGLPEVPGTPQPGDLESSADGSSSGPAAGDPTLRDAARTLGAALRRETTAGMRAARNGVAGGTAAAMAGARSLAARAGQRGGKAAEQHGDAAAAAPAGDRPAPRSFFRRRPLGEAAERPVRPARRTRAPGTRAIRFGWRLFLWSLFLLAFGVGATLVTIWLTMRDLPLADILPALEEPTISVKTIDGQVLTTQGAYRAPYVGLDEFPPHLPEAVMAIEDRRFPEHNGVDFRGISRALYRNFAAGGVVEGGSTLSQQLVKILYLEPERTISRKLQEAVLATTLERQLGKDRIIELYLNSVYLGSGAYGMPAAAERYFGKDVSELTLPESAVLAASIQLPSQVNPVADLAAAQNRAALVLNLMEDQGRINEATRDQALAQLALLTPEPPDTRAGSYFADWVLDEVAAFEGASSEGLTATATLDPGIQEIAQRVVSNVITRQGAEVGATQAAVVVMSPNGRVRAMVGGVDYEQSQFNRATEALRQPGSTFKLFVYMAAMVMGAKPGNTISDAPIAVGDWEPQNFDGQSHGTVTLREAFARSLNQATVRLAQEVGTDNLIAVAQRFGIESELVPRPSLALGATEVTLLDMTEAFAALALGRTPVNATGIEALQFGEEGNALGVSGANDREQTRLSRTREPMLDLLRAVVEEGTGRGARVEGIEVFGKTGTSQENRDAWFIGFAQQPRLVIGVWVGNDDNSPMDEVTGGGLPAEIFRRILRQSAELAQAGAPLAQQVRAETEQAPAQCDIRACSAAYRSFRDEDCTYQPFEGPRRICTR